MSHLRMLFKSCNEKESYTHKNKAKAAIMCQLYTGMQHIKMAAVKMSIYAHTHTKKNLSQQQERRNGSRQLYSTFITTSSIK